tara:strand:+ start:119 stop:1066 length:948 start_codon:yes stop_codon:yes gene_type:complete
MPQVKEPLITRLVKEVLKEAELTVGQDNTKFNIKLLVSNPQSETKLGIRIQLKPKEGFLDPEKKGQLEAAIMKKFNNSLEKFNLQISLDTDTPDPEVMGFFIPLPQLKNMIVSALGGSPEEAPSDNNTAPKPPVPSRPTNIPKPTPGDDKEDEIEEQTAIDLKRRKIDNEEKEGIPALYEKVTTIIDLLKEVFEEIENPENNFDFASTVFNEGNVETTEKFNTLMMGIESDLSERLEDEEPVGPDRGVEELKKIIKTQLNEMRVRDLKEISGVVLKEDFYSFINAGQNVLRTLEEHAPHLNGKKYLEYLVKHNIM